MPKRKLALGPPWCARVPIRKKRRVRGVCLLACLLARFKRRLGAPGKVRYAASTGTFLEDEMHFCREMHLSHPLACLLACLLPSLAQETSLSHPLACLLASFSCARDKIVSCARE